jgi:hypothetical protein
MGMGGSGLIIGCTVVDYLIWMIRWRPYLLWRAFFRVWAGSSGDKADSLSRAMTAAWISA